MDYHQQEQIMQFLNGLNDAYAATREQILFIEPLPPLSNVYAVVLNQESQKGLTISTKTNSDTTALLSKFNSAPQFHGKAGFSKEDR